MTLLALLACGDSSFTVSDAAPQVTVLRPVDGATFEPSEPVVFCAQLADEDLVSELTVSLSSSVDGLVWEFEPPEDGCDGGNFGFAVTLSDADHTLSLAVIDTRGQTTTATLDLLASSNTAPSCTLSAPVDGDSILLDESVEVAGSVGDGETDAAGLTVSVSSDLDGELWSGATGTDGNLGFTWTPAVAGDHLVELRVEDPRGLSDLCSTTLTVIDCLPTDEEPNGTDDDCDGTIDEGTTLYDDDGDGWAEVDGDCDDVNDDAYPGGTEVPYDGIDQDCDGSDLEDVDADGYTAELVGGEDCDDDDASVNPGAVETWYDGVDQDCDDHSDDDADFDGYDAQLAGGLDCDDRDATVNPGAGETWYDGIDQDCAGDDDDDADGDGFASEDQGGLDCDDSDASAWPGATETRDGSDDDCDDACDEGLVTAGELIVTEIMKDTDAVEDSAGEWFELYNTSAIDIRLCTDWAFEDDGGETHSLADGYSLLVPSGSYVVLGRSEDTATNGGVTVDYAYGSGMWLGNDDDELVLVHGGTEIDRVEYDGGSTWPDPRGASLTLDPRSFDATDNDDPDNWCEASTPYGDGDLGTPGSANDGC